jgi:glycosyltransferase involved in cell wall biosynthesis
MVPDVRPIVAPMPIEPTLVFPSRERERNRLLFAGKLNAQKGIEHLLRALALMRARPTLDIVVGVGSREEETRALADSLGVANQLRWHALLGQSELATMYRRATALVVPAVDEGLGLTAVEALFCETPVVAFASGGLTDIVVHDRTGLLVPPRDAQALAAQLDALLARDDQGASLGRAGRMQAMSTFAPAAAASRYADIYESVIGSRTA